MTTSRSRIEQAKALRAIKGITTTDSEFETIRRTLFPTSDPARDRALVGLSHEDEFAILCRVMGTCRFLAPLDQTPLLSGNDAVIPDHLVYFEPGCSVLGLSSEAVRLPYRCFVEVKSDDRTKYRISERDLKRREAFAQAFDLPLVFAVRFTQFVGQAAWLLVTSHQFRSLGRTLALSNLMQGVGHALLDDYILAAPNPFDIECVWDSSAPVQSLRTDGFGSLVQLHMFDGGTRVAVDDGDALLVGVVLEAFRPVSISTRRQGAQTTELLRVAGDQGRSLSNIVYVANQQATDSGGQTVYDPARIRASLDAPTPHLSLLARDHVEYIVARYFLNRRLWKLAIGNPKDQLALLKRLSKHPLKE